MWLRGVTAAELQRSAGVAASPKSVPFSSVLLLRSPSLFFWASVAALYIKVCFSFNFYTAPPFTLPPPPSSLPRTHTHPPSQFLCCRLKGPISRIRGPPQQGSVSRLSTQLIMILRPSDEWSSLIGWHCENTGTHFQRP